MRLKNQPRIRDRPMPGVQKPDPDPGDIYARGAETRLRFEGHFCPVCRNMPQIQGTFMHGVHYLPPVCKWSVRFFCRLFPEDFRQFLLYFVAAQAADEDGSVGVEEDDFGDSVDAVKFRSNCLRVQDLRIWDRLV